LTIWEVVLYAINNALADHWGASDVGGSLTIHAFGAYFGLAASWVLSSREKNSSKAKDLNSSSYISNIFSLIGTFVLFIFWPSFVSVFAKGSS